VVHDVTDSAQDKRIMNAKGWLSQWLTGWIQHWDQFWFSPRRAHTLAAIRIATGAMLAYAHLVLASDLMSFLGTTAWIDRAASRALHDGSFAPAEAVWTYLWYTDSPAFLWVHQVLAICLSLCLMIGLGTRVVAPLVWFIQLMFVHRLTGALYGLDQVTTMLSMYLMIAPSGSVWSVDAMLRRKLCGGSSVKTPVAGAAWLNWLLPAEEPSVAANVATRLAQLHLCVIYLFGGLWKARGQLWWDGTALWFAASSYEYQSNDLTWIGQYPLVFAALTHATVFWETFYCALVWPKSTRPIILLMAVMVHGGIAIYLGMVTFGLMMIVANAIFLEPEWLARPARKVPE
jgi:hypothetical protein